MFEICPERVNDLMFQFTKVMFKLYDTVVQADTTTESANAPFAHGRDPMVK